MSQGEYYNINNKLFPYYCTIDSYFVSCIPQKISRMSRLLIYFFIFLCTNSSFGQTTSGNSRVFHYSSKDGLSFGVVNSITQDKKGFIWFATADGLNRFDGSEFKVFKTDPDNKYSLSANYVQTVFKDSEEILWVTSRNGLSRFDPEKEEFITHQFFTDANLAWKNDVSHLSEGRDGRLWVAFSNSGFASFDKKTRKAIYFHRENLVGLESNDILNVYEDRQGLLWVGTQESGIKVFKIDANRKLKKASLDIVGLPLERINSLYEDHLHNIWIASSKGLILYQRQENNFHVYHARQYGLKSDIFLSVTQNQHKQLLVGLQDGGLFTVDIAQSVQVKPADYVFQEVKGESGYSLTPRSVQSLYQDKDKNIWVGTYGSGLYMISNADDRFKKFQKKLDGADGETFMRFYGMCIDEQGYLWLGTDGDGIYKSTPTGQTIKHYKADGRKGSITSNAILYGFKDSKNQLWFGTYSEGLFLYNKESDSFTNFKHDPKNQQSLGNNDVRVIYEDSKQNIWIGTNGGGLSVLDPITKKIKTYNAGNSGINSNDIRSVLEDKHGNLWIGAYGNGLQYFLTKEKTFNKYYEKINAAKLLSNEVIFSLYLDKKERLWIGTEHSGLVLFDTKNQIIKRYDEKAGLANNTIYAIKAESHEKLWVSTNKGLSKIDIAANKIFNYDATSGLVGGQFNPGSALYSEEGKFMCFAGTEGWNIFNPAKINESNYKPAVIITGLQLFGKQAEAGMDSEHKSVLDKDISEMRSIVLQPNESVFSLQYVALNYAYPKDAEFAYKLEGLDKDWNFVKNQRSATYRYLDPGTYIFKVKASNQDKVWSNQYASIEVVVLPPWYKTWWAYVFYFGVAGALVYFYIHYRTKQEKLKYEIQISHIESEKEKELHERKLTFFTNISHEFRTPLTLIINPVKELLYNKGGNEEISTLNIVYRNARRLLSLVDQLLLFRKAESETDKLKVVKLNLHNLCNEVFLCFTYQAKAKNIHYEFNSTNNQVEVYGDREKLEIALFNLISNALKFTPASGSVILNVTQTEKDIIIEVKDTGPGIAEHIGAKLFDRFYQIHDNHISSKGGFGIGLYLVKSFVESHHGEINYVSKPGEGTTFQARLLQGKDHFTTNLIFEDVAESSVFLEELIEDTDEIIINHEKPNESVEAMDEIWATQKSILVVDDNTHIRQYIKQIFKPNYDLYEAENGEDGWKMVQNYQPDIVISDVMMHGISGVELCARIKDDPSLSHIPVILLTASSSSEVKLKGIECGADDYISKPFEKELLLARVAGILKSRNNLQKYFYNEITLKSENLKISKEYKEFLDRCIEIVEQHLTDQEFTIKNLADEIGMSRSNLYLKVKSISGQSANSFIRYIRLRKAAELFVSTDFTVYETAYQVGIKDPKYFREQFNKLFNMNPSDYIKKFRKTFHNNYNLKKKSSE